MNRNCLTVLFWAFCSCLVSAEDIRLLPDSTATEIETLIASEMSERGIPGMTVAIAIDNQLQYCRGFGLCDVENQIPMRPDSSFRTASIAKPITAVVVLALAQQNHLDLDAPVQQYCLDYPEKEWPLTSRQLLGHLGGVRHYKNSAESRSTRYFPDLNAALQTFRDDPLLHPPGSKFLYSTFGYNLLGSVAEGASGQSFSELLQTRVFEPAGMSQTIIDEQFSIVPNRVRGYFRARPIDLMQHPAGSRLKIGELYNASLHDTSMKIPGGGLLSTAGDLVRFATAVNQRHLLSDEQVNLMWTAQQTTDGNPTEYGLGWRISDEAGLKAVGHSGGQAGTSTHLLLIPETGTTVSVMCNLQNVTLKDLAHSLARCVSKLWSAPA